MGLKDLTKAAQEARDAAEELARKRTMEHNGQAAIRITSGLLQISRDAIRVERASNIAQVANEHYDMSGKGTIVIVNIGGDEIRMTVGGALRSSNDMGRWVDWHLLVMEPNDTSRMLQVSENQPFKDRMIERPLWTAADRPVKDLASLGDLFDAYLHYYKMYKEQGKDLATPLYYLKEDA